MCRSQIEAVTVSGSGLFSGFSFHHLWFMYLQANNANTIIRQFLITAVPPVSLQQTYWENSNGEEEDIKEYKAIYLAQFQSGQYPFQAFQTSTWLLWEDCAADAGWPIMAGGNGHVLRKLCEAPTNLLSQHFSISHAGQKHVDTVTWKSSVSRYFSMNRWVI